MPHLHKTLMKGVSHPEREKKNRFLIWQSFGRGTSKLIHSHYKTKLTKVIKLLNFNVNFWIAVNTLLGMSLSIPWFPDQPQKGAPCWKKDKIMKYGELVINLT